MKRLFGFWFLILHSQLFCQSTTLPIKEDYDRFNQELTNRYNPCGIGTEKDQTVFGDGMSHILDGYLTMYKTTSDKSYLYKFILQSLCIIENRHDLAGVSDQPIWGELTYEDGLIIGSMAHFVYDVLMDKELSESKLYAFPELNGHALNTSFTSFRDVAEWMDGQVQKTLFWYINQGYWNDLTGFLDQPKDQSGLVVNKQVGFARAALYIGLLHKELGLLQKANRVARLYKEPVVFYDRKAKKKYTAPMLMVDDQDAYWWYHYGWTIPYRKKEWWQKKVQPSYKSYTYNAEDISHGALVSYLMVDYYRLGFHEYFGKDDMRRMRNTFVRNINDGQGGFYNAVNGTDFPISDTKCKGECPHNYHALKALSYSPFVPFDSCYTQEKGAYDIIVSYYTTALSSQRSFPKGYCCGMNKGHAELVQQQWLKGPITLRFFHRKIVYNQDFNIDGDLIISPLDGEGLSYAEPQIIEKKWTIESGVKSTVTASKSIQLKSGTHFKSGSRVHLRINE